MAVNDVKNPVLPASSTTGSDRPVEVLQSRLVLVPLNVRSTHWSGTMARVHAPEHESEVVVVAVANATGWSMTAVEEQNQLGQ